MMGQNQDRSRYSGTNRPHGPVNDWQRKCLFTILLGLFFLVFFNFVITLWLLKILELNIAGIEGLTLLTGGIKLPGKTFVLGSLVSSNIFSINPVTFDSPHNFTIDTSDYLGRITNSLFIDEQRLQSHASVFTVSNSRGRKLLTVNRHEVVVGSDSLRVSGFGGNVFDGSLQTNEIESGIGADLRLESPSKRLQLTAQSGVKVDSIAGDISVTSLEDITLKSVDGGIRIESSGVYLPGLRSAHSPRTSAVRTASRIYQLCACSNGKLFLASSEGDCVTTRDSTTCR